MDLLWWLQRNTWYVLSVDEQYRTTCNPSLLLLFIYVRGMFESNEEQLDINRFLVAEAVGVCEVHKRIKVVYGKYALVLIYMQDLHVTKSISNLRMMICDPVKVNTSPVVKSLFRLKRHWMFDLFLRHRSSGQRLTLAPISAKGLLWEMYLTLGETVAIVVV